MINKQKGFAPIIILLGIVIASAVGGGAYYVVKGRPPQQKACALIQKICPDGSNPERNRLTCEFAPCPSPSPTETFEPVAVSQLITNMNQFENKKVSVKGIYAAQMTVQVMCVPAASDSAPLISEEYQFYPTTWVITEGKGADTLGVKVLDKNNAVSSTLPNYKMREEIELKGIVRTTTVPDQCRSNIQHKSIYLEVKEEDVNLISKSSPQNPPITDISTCDALIGQKDNGNFVKGEILVGFKDDVSLGGAQGVVQSLGLGIQDSSSFNSIKLFLVKVPESTELKWICVFKQNSLVKYAETNNTIKVPDCSKGPC